MRPVIGAAHAAAKAGWTTAYATSIVVSVAAHFALFAWNPQFRAGVLGMESSELEMIEMTTPEVDVPPPPQAIARPATPVVSAARIDDDITIAPTTFEANPVTALPPPPAASSTEADLRDAPRFTPYTVRPELQNVDEVKAALVRRYPRLLRDAGVGATVVVWVFIDEHGVVHRSLVKAPSGYPEFDAAALATAPEMKFSPAINRSQRVPVWIEIPLVFSTR